MIQLQFNKRFKKRFQKCPPALQDQFRKRLALFLENPANSLLRNHPLKGNLVGSWAFSVSGDYRAIYQRVSLTCIKFVDIGTHTQVYE